MQKRVAAGFLLFAPLLFGQLDSNSVTVTASSTANLPPDQVVFSIMVSSGPGQSTSLTDVVGALQPIAITVANFTGLNNVESPNPNQPPPIIWDFSLPAPLAKIKETVARLTALQQTLPNQNNGLRMSFGIQGTQVSQQLQQSQPCVLADLLAQAHTQAQNLATAAGFALDVIQAMSSTVTTSVSNQAETLSSFLLGSSSAPCTVTVKFGLIRY